MSLLAPLFLLGALAIAAPILAHLVRRTTRERVQFSATRFLDASPPTISKRRRIEHPWLLLLRALIFCVLALGFSRPFFRTENPVVPKATPPRHLVIVLDQSASMQRIGAFPEALRQVRALAAGLNAGDRLAIVGTGSSVPLLAADQWSSVPTLDARRAILESTLERLQPGWGPTWLDTAIDLALEEVDAMNELAGGVSPCEIAVVSDFSAGTRISGLAGREWPEGTHLTLANVPHDDSGNASLHGLGWTQLASGARAARLHVSNHSTRARPVDLRLFDAESGAPLGAARTETLAPSETRVVLLEIPDTEARALRVDLTGDLESFDNTVWLVAPQVTEIDVGYIGPFDVDDPRHSHYYLSRALAGSRDLRPELHAITPGSLQMPESIALFVVAHPLSGDIVRHLRERVEGGAIALVLASDESILATAGSLAGESGWTTSAYTRADALLGEIDFSHPQFEVFADPRFSDFTHVRFWKPVPLALPGRTAAQVVARFEEGSPAVVEVSIGTGAMIVWGGDWQPGAGQWVLSSKFVPWVHSLLERASGGARGPSSGEFGAAGLVAVTSGQTWEPIGNAPGDDAAVSSPQQPGIFRLTEDGRSRLVALQVPASESVSGSLDLDTWEQIGAPLTLSEFRRTPSDRPAGIAQAVNLENEQKLWRFLLLAAIILLAMESLFAIRLSRLHGQPAATQDA